MPGPSSGYFDEHGEAVQVDPIEPKLKPPESNRLKLENEKTLSNLL
jgi:hypothetical protein